MTVAIEQRQILWIGPAALPGNVRQALGDRWRPVRAGDPARLTEQLRLAEVVLIASDAEDFDPAELARLLDRVDRSGAVAVVLLPEDLPTNNVLSRRRGQFVLTRMDAAPEELAGRIEAAAALQPAIRHLQDDVANVRSFGPAVGGHREDLDEELRLAARLQRDFLPRSLPAVGAVHFATIFRPVGWVSGDLYDVFRLDEEHVGFYVADVVGHGMPAALLTMFVKRSLQTKRILGKTYQIIPPDVTLAMLNDDLCQQDLTSCQFVTAAYGVINCRTLVLRYARGGHPAPLVLGPDGGARRLEAIGPLLGVFPGETFQGRQVQLAPGQRVIFYSDGAEDTLSPGGPSGTQDGEALARTLQPIRHLPVEQMLLQLTTRIDQSRPNGRHADDVTVVAMDVAATPA